MAMKIYITADGREAWFHPQDVPEGAKEWKPEKPCPKVVETRANKPANKSAKVENK